MKGMGSYERLYEMLPPALPAPRLCERAMDGIRLEMARAASTRFFAALAATLASLAGMVYALRALSAAAYESGFTAYASLAFSDGPALSGHLGAFGTALLDSLPGPEAALALAVLAVLIQSARVALGSGAAWRHLRAHVS
jgi:hypothetical protein